MKYRIQFVYFDGKDIVIPLESEKLSEFFKRLNENRIYWFDEGQKEGFWLNIAQIRYIKLYAQEEVKNEEGSCQTGDGELPKQVSCASDGKGDDQSA